MLRKESSATVYHWHDNRTTGQYCFWTFSDFDVSSYFALYYTCSFPCLQILSPWLPASTHMLKTLPLPLPSVLKTNLNAFLKRARAETNNSGSSKKSLWFTPSLFKIIYHQNYKCPRSDIKSLSHINIVFVFLWPDSLSFTALSSPRITLCPKEHIKYYL